jgi:hypothetical protein
LEIKNLLSEKKSAFEASKLQFENNYQKDKNMLKELIEIEINSFFEKLDWMQIQEVFIGRQNLIFYIDQKSLFKDFDLTSFNGKIIKDFFELFIRSYLEDALKENKTFIVSSTTDVFNKKFTTIVKLCPEIFRRS